MKISEAIEELVTTWILWVKNDIIARSHEHDVELRKSSALECEKLIKRRYELIDIIDKNIKE